MHERLGVCNRLDRLRWENLAGLNALTLLAGNAAGEDRLYDQGKRHPCMEGADAGPLTGSFLACGVKDLVQQIRSILFLEGEDILGDFDEIGVQVALIPLGEHLVHLLVAKAGQAPHQVIYLSYELHVPVLNAVVHHLYKVPCSAFADPVAAGNAINMGGDSLKQGFYLLPSGLRTTGHDRGPLQSSLFAAADTGADVQKALALHVSHPALAVLVVGVPSIDDDVSLVQKREEGFDGIVDSTTGFDHHHHLARGLERIDQLLQAVGAENLLTLCPSVDKGIHLGGTAVVHRNTEVLALQIEHQVLSHYCEADQADCCFHSVTPTYLIYDAWR
ncbi:hypothetical protein SDC9_126459 [bioreactor metagenome]|uniref:Uncharacterized protein n=1 Tax=bioreactor metagenome TaxID=1076179 RepID=A0A645CQS3_9ZZZZ